MKKLLISALSALLLSTTGAMAAGSAPKAPQQDWGFASIPFGTFDRDALRRGHQVYTEVCASCHSLNLIAYRNLMEIGFTEDEVKAIAGDVEVQDGPNDEGEMFDRPGRPADKFINPFANENEAKAANNGAFPPDLSLMVKARMDGANYLYALMTGYKEEAPEGFELGDGQYYNDYFPGHALSMPPPIVEEGVEYADGTKATVEQQAKDVVEFLAWTASPELEERHRLGVKVMIFLLVLTAMFYALKRQIWSRIH